MNTTLRLSAALILLSLALSGRAGAVTAPEVSRTDRAEVRLHADHLAAAPGAIVTLALDQRLRGAWHSYWRNPGDTGVRTMIRWTAPEGVAISAIRWPAPRRIRVATMTNYGFKERAVLRAELRVPSDWPVGRAIRVTAEATWLLCRDICVPERAVFTLALPVRAAPVENAAVARLTAEAAAAAPTQLKGAARYAVDGDAIRLVVETPAVAMGAPRAAYFFAATPGVVIPSAPQRFESKGGVVTLVAARADRAKRPPDPLEGVLALEFAARDGGAPTRVSYALSATAGGLAPLSASPISAEAAGFAAGVERGLGRARAALFAFLAGLNVSGVFALAAPAPPVVGAEPGPDAAARGR